MAQEYIDISSGSQYYYSSSLSLPGGGNKLLNFYSVKHLYYSNYNTGSGVVDNSGSFFNYEESSISVLRKLESSGEGVVFSIPKNLFGTHIEPGSINLSNGSYTLLDDGEGNLFQGSTYAGNVIYTHGQIIVNTWPYNTSFSSSVDTVSFKSNVPIYTHNYTIKISDYEYNHTLNPTAQSGSTVLDYSGSKYLQPSGQYANNITGSDFQPYITTIGLYNDSNELIAVGKLAQPVPKPADTELTIQVKLDV